MKRLPLPRAAAPALLMGVALAAGCSGPPPIFPPVEPPIRWPAGGDAPRFAYVGRIEGEADLKRPRSFWRRVVDLVGGAEAQARIRSAAGVAVIGEVLYVADPEERLVHRFDLARREHRALTDAGGGRRFESPIGLAARDGDLLVSDRSLRTVSVLSGAGEPVSVLGAGLLEAPVGVAAAEDGSVYVADVGSHRVQRFDRTGRATLAFGKRGGGPGEFNFPTHVACGPGGEIFVSDSLNFRVQVFDREGSYLRSWGQKGDSPGDFSQPKGIACDHAGRVYVVDSNFENLQVFSPEGSLLLAIGSEGRGPGEFWLPVGVSTDAVGRVWVGDSYNQRVQVFRYIGKDRASEERAP